MPFMTNGKRDYKKELRWEHKKKPNRVKDRAKRNAARATVAKKNGVKPTSLSGDVGHKKAIGRGDGIGDGETEAIGLGSTLGAGDGDTCGAGSSEVDTYTVKATPMATRAAEIASNKVFNLSVILVLSFLFSNP